ncbi:MAG TPA: hypothetical protein VK558_12270 [Patescibacteria group bacterium]|nr:hypothetical protein [Patescibacteria group bacterium]
MADEIDISQEFEAAYQSAALARALASPPLRRDGICRECEGKVEPHRVVDGISAPLCQVCADDAKEELRLKKGEVAAE